MKITTKHNISLSTLKPFLLMTLFVLCILNAGIVRADQVSIDQLSIGSVSTTVENV